MRQGITSYLMDALPKVTQVQIAEIEAAPRTAAAHRDLLTKVPAMNALQVGGAAQADRLPATFNVATWNLERCLFPVDSAAHLARFAPQVVLLSEVDSGMARTGQANTTAEMAAAMGMRFAFGVEFYEMDLGGPTERQFCKDDFNADGWHGNAILSAVPFEKLAMLRMDLDGHWFRTDDGGAGDPAQPRLGGRMAIFAIVQTANGPICVVSTHLESNAGPVHRGGQFDQIMDFVDDFAPDLPVVIGGDLNTGNHIPPKFDWRDETLFEAARARGYSWDLTAEGITTRPSLITPHPTRQMKLDWFATRGLSGAALPILPAVDDEGTVLSDHECMLCRITL